MIRSVIALVAVAGLIGCGGGDAAPTGTIDAAAAQRLESELWVEIEARTAECMRAQGFDYVERQFIVPADVRFGASPFDLTADQVATDGFGIVAGMDGGDDVQPDPNDELQSALDETMRRDWNVALYGETSPGCRGRATDAVMTDRAGPLVEVEAQLVERGSRIETDPRYVQMWEDWSACMLERHGMVAVDVAQLQDQFATQAATLVPDPVAPPVAEGAEPAPIDTSGSADRVAELRLREIEAAVASVACLDPLRGTWQQIQADADADD